MENPDIDRPAVHIGFPFFAALFVASFFGAPFAADDDSPPRFAPPFRRFCCSPPFFCFFCLSNIDNGRISCFPSSLPQPHSRCLQLQ